ncbi:MAG: NAD(P)-binding protein [Chitinivibrionales bacterium]|nr:NAD(P)-binding protein [Chitinivibrionales bacterium]
MPPTENTFDAIVIGSGIGGLAAAALLTKIKKMRVLVLEKHFEIGGLTHVFSRGRYKWDVGLHYVGRMEGEDLPKALFDYITDGRIKWNKMKDPFERFVFPGIDFGVPSEKREFKRLLIKRYPDQKRQIDAYFRDVVRANRRQVRHFLAGFLPHPLCDALRLLNLFANELALMTLEQWFDKYKVKQELRAVLAARWGDYGATPEVGIFGIHAMVMRHYFQGGHFPEGYSSRIASTIEQVIEKQGGMVLINREATDIIIQDNRAVGVRVINHALQNARTETYYAPCIISNAGISITAHKLLPDSLRPKVFAHLDRVSDGCSSVALYLALKDSPQTIGITGENVWISETLDHSDIDRQTDELIGGNPRKCFVSFPSLKSGEDKRHTVEIVALVNSGHFQRWKNQRWRQRDDDYCALKSRISDSLLDLAEKYIPGLKRLVIYRELSTPLTLEHFTGRPGGSMYGLLPDAHRYRTNAFKPETSLQGLYLSGSDVCSVGIVGGLMGGLAAASSILGGAGLFRIIAAARIRHRFNRKKLLRLKPVTKKLSPVGDKVSARLVEKNLLTKSIYEFVYRLPAPVAFLPGQFAKIMYSDVDYGSYSIADIQDTRLRFIIDLKFGGAYVDYFYNLQMGEFSTIRLPIGDFTLRPTSNRKVFCATGTGISPLLPMLKTLDSAPDKQRATLFFGCRYRRDNFIERYTAKFGGNLHLDVMPCISGEQVDGAYFGRVTGLLHELDDDIHSSDFYISGNPAMVRDVASLLEKKGAGRIYYEKF